MSDRDVTTGPDASEIMHLLTLIEADAREARISHSKAVQLERASVRPQVLTPGDVGQPDPYERTARIIHAHCTARQNCINNVLACAEMLRRALTPPKPQAAEPRPELALAT